ncbi:MAG: hypothetical protein ACKO2G_06915 [Verrucomicrobiales bacterium]
MTYAEFSSLVTQAPCGVVLLEGRRAISDEYAILAENLARHLASEFPSLRFRSGNAEGADAAFSRGIAAIDPRRLQVVAPYSSHRKSLRYSEAEYDSPDSLLLSQEEEIATKTIWASPKSKGMIAKRGQSSAAGAKALYLLRDTMKVTGHSDSFPKPICALFYVNLEDPMDGGTGHTIRVCRQEGVPAVFQDSWAGWLG